jgi:glutathione peroxidase-family protein
MKFYDFSAKKMNGKEVKMEEYRGNVVKRYAPITTPSKLRGAIEKLLK